jgi:hypothetical protein
MQPTKPMQRYTPNQKCAMLVKMKTNALFTTFGSEPIKPISPARNDSSPSISLHTTS